MRAPERRPLTSREIVDAVAAADLGEYVASGDAAFDAACNTDYRARTSQFLAGLGLDFVDYLRARVAVKLNDLGDKK